MLYTIILIYAASWLIALSIIIYTLHSMVKENIKATYAHFLGFAMFITLAPITLLIFAGQSIYRRIKTGAWL